MPDEAKDQVPGKGQSYKLPETDFFSGDKMDKFMDEIELMEKSEQAASPKKQETPKEEKPCSDCAKKKAEGASEAKPAETRQPIAVLKVNGQDTPVYTEKELHDLAQKGAHYTQERQKDARWEDSLKAREKKVSDAVARLEALVQQGFVPKAPEKEAAELAEAMKKRQAQEAELEAIEDPAAREAIKRRDAELAELRRQSEDSRKATQGLAVEKITTELNNVLTAVREKYPFEEIIDEETGRNVTQEMFTGLFLSKMNDETARQKEDPEHEIKPIHQLMEETARDLYTVDSKHKKGAKEAAVMSADNITADLVLEKFPQVAEEIGQRAVAAHLKTLESAPPLARGRSDGQMRRPGDNGRKSSSGGFSGLDEAFAKAEQDSEIASALDESQKKARFSA